MLEGFPVYFDKGGKLSAAGTYKRSLGQGYLRGHSDAQVNERKMKSYNSEAESRWWFNKHVCGSVSRTWPEVPLTYIYDYMV